MHEREQDRDHGRQEPRAPAANAAHAGRSARPPRNAAAWRALSVACARAALERGQQEVQRAAPARRSRASAASARVDTNRQQRRRAAQAAPARAGAAAGASTATGRGPRTARTGTRCSRRRRAPSTAVDPAQRVRGRVRCRAGSQRERSPPTHVIVNAIRIHAPLTSQLFVFGRVSSVRNSRGRVQVLDQQEGRDEREQQRDAAPAPSAADASRAVRARPRTARASRRRRRCPSSRGTAATPPAPLHLVARVEHRARVGRERQRPRATARAWRGGRSLQRYVAGRSARPGLQRDRLDADVVHVRPGALLGAAHERRARRRPCARCWLVGSCRSPATIACSGQTITHAGSRPCSTRCAQ